jgi:ankyrin repeat protein
MFGSSDNMYSAKTTAIAFACGIIYLLVIFVYIPRHDSALLDAIVNHDLQAARQAFRDGATMSISFKNENTFLHGAAYHGQVEMAQLLIEHGAARFLHARNDEGMTPIDLAVSQKHIEMAEYLRSVDSAK